MNKDYLPILGEASDLEKKFVLNILSIRKLTIKLKICNQDSTFFTEDVLLEKNKCTRKIFTYDVEKIWLDDNVFTFNFSSTNTWKFNFLNCDCQFVPQCGLVNEVPLSNKTISFHLGDQIYMDLLYMDVMSNTYTIEEIREKIYQEYMKAFLRKKDVLQKTFNIMLGDDHEICDETLRELTSENTTQIFKDIFNEIQQGLKLTDASVIHYDTNSFILINNINILDSKNYMISIKDTIEKANDFKAKTYLLSPRNLLNSNNSRINNLIFSAVDNNENYNEFFTLLFNKFQNNKKELVILCGDEHTAGKFTIKQLNSGNILDFYFVGPLNSVVDPLKNKFILNNENFIVEKQYLEQSHAFMTLIDDKLYHDIQHSTCINIMGTISYTIQYSISKIKFKLSNCCKN